MSDNQSRSDTALLAQTRISEDDMGQVAIDAICRPLEPIVKQAMQVAQCDAAPSIVLGMDPQQYHADTGSVSAHGLLDLARSPLHHWWSHRRPECVEEPSDAQKLGTAIHMAVLEPDRFARHYRVAPKVDRRTKEGKAIYAEFLEQLGDGEVISAENHAAALRVANAVGSHPLGVKLLSGSGKAEASVYWTDRETGVRCRIRPDFVPDASPVIVDLKSTSDARENAFQRSAWNFGYHLTAAFYQDGWLAATGEKRDYVFAAWEKDEPHACAWYYAEDEMLGAGREKYRRMLRIYADCLASGRWGDGYPVELQPLYLPKWAIEE